MEYTAWFSCGGADSSTPESTFVHEKFTEEGNDTLSAIATNRCPSGDVFAREAVSAREVRAAAWRDAA